MGRSIPPLLPTYKYRAMNNNKTLSKIGICVLLAALATLVVYLAEVIGNAVKF